MEIIRNYIEVDELFEHIKKIADNLEEMTRIMKTEKTIKNTLYGMSVARPCPDQDKCYLCGKENEIQDLKLENDRLQKRNDYMYDFIYSISKSGLKWTSVRADMIIKKLEEL